MKNWVLRKIDERHLAWLRRIATSKSGSCWRHKAVKIFGYKFLYQMLITQHLKAVDSNTITLGPVGLLTVFGDRVKEAQERRGQIEGLLCELDSVQGDINTFEEHGDSGEPEYYADLYQDRDYLNDLIERCRHKLMSYS